MLSLSLSLRKEYPHCLCKPMVTYPHQSFFPYPAVERQCDTVAVVAQIAAVSATGNISRYDYVETVASGLEMIKNMASFDRSLFASPLSPRTHSPTVWRWTTEDGWSEARKPESISGPRLNSGVAQPRHPTSPIVSRSDIG